MRFARVADALRHITTDGRMTLCGRPVTEDEAGLKKHPCARCVIVKAERRSP